MFPLDEATVTPTVFFDAATSDTLPPQSSAIFRKSTPNDRHNKKKRAQTRLFIIHLKKQKNTPVLLLNGSVCFILYFVF